MQAGALSLTSVIVTLTIAVADLGISGSLSLATTIKSIESSSKDSASNA